MAEFHDMARVNGDREHLERLRQTRTMAIKRAHDTMRQIRGLYAQLPGDWSTEDTCRIRIMMKQLAHEKAAAMISHNAVLDEMRDLRETEQAAAAEDTIWLNLRDACGRVTARAEARLIEEELDDEEASSSEAAPEDDATPRPVDPQVLDLMKMLTDSQITMKEAFVLAQKKADTPEINVLTFSGSSADDFVLFREAFRSKYEKRGYLTEEEKFSELRRLVKGGALNTINGLIPEAGSLALAWSLLEKKYGTKEIILKGISDQLDKLPAAKDDSQVEAIRTIYDKMVIFDRRMTCNSCPGGFTTIREWQKKLPHSFKVEWARAVTTDKKDPNSMTQFLEAMENKLLILEQAGPEEKPAPAQKQGAAAKPAAAPKQQGAEPKKEAGKEEPFNYVGWKRRLPGYPGYLQYQQQAEQFKQQQQKQQRQVQPPQQQQANQKANNPAQAGAQQQQRPAPQQQRQHQAPGQPSAAGLNAQVHQQRRQ